MKKYIIILSLFVASCAHEPTLLGILETDSPEFAGSIDREKIRQVIRENLKSFEGCYDQALKRNRDVYGKIVVQWQIVEAGKAEKVIIKESNTKDTKFDKCVADVVATLTFPLPPEGQIAQVSYPLVFTSGDNSPRFKSPQNP